MRTLLVSALLALAACGLTEEKFLTEFEADRCAALDACGSSLQCDDGTEVESGTGTTPGCDFDPDKAKECLDATWECDTSANAITPAPCLEVYLCAGDET